jgi:protocatechuate 3,4-dioxygenase beta subunit
VAAGSGGGGIGSLLGADAAAASCTLTPETTAGPFWEDERLNRSNLVGGQAGVPLELTLRIVDADDACSPYRGAWVDIWHCNAAGDYSDEPAGLGNPDTLGETWLRGFQVSKATGKVRFKTIYPGYYPGRTIHVHVRVRTFAPDDSLAYDFTTQLFFAEAANDAVYATEPYEEGSRTTTNSTDAIYAEAAAAGNPMLIRPVGNPRSGYSGAATIALTGLPPGRSNDTAVDARLRSARFARRKSGRRRLDLKIRAGERLTATAKLTRRGRTIARKRIDGLRAGGVRQLSVPVPDRVEGGRARLELLLEDRTGNRKRIERRIEVPR